MVMENRSGSMGLHTRGIGWRAKLRVKASLPTRMGIYSKGHGLKGN